VPASKFLFAIVLILFAVGSQLGCKTDYSLKPNGYPRIEYPRQGGLITYADSGCPFTFQLPDYYLIDRNVTFFNEEPEDPCWMNLVCSDLNATIYLSYKQLDSDISLQKLIEDAYKLTYKHSERADFIEPQQIENQYGVQGLIYFVGGDAASNFQFFITDTASHFVRGSLYFYTHPNADSLQPVIQFMVRDIEEMLGSWQWRQAGMQRSKVQ
jgi:gliding motility-associated lipoprotein GldD